MNRTMNSSLVGKMRSAKNSAMKNVIIGSKSQKETCIGGAVVIVREARRLS